MKHFTTGHGFWLPDQLDITSGSTGKLTPCGISLSQRREANNNSLTSLPSNHSFPGWLSNKRSKRFSLSVAYFEAVAWHDNLLLLILPRLTSFSLTLTALGLHLPYKV